MRGRYVRCLATRKSASTYLFSLARPPVGADACRPCRLARLSARAPQNSLKAVRIRLKRKQRTKFYSLYNQNDRLKGIASCPCPSKQPKSRLQETTICPGGLLAGRFFLTRRNKEHRRIKACPLVPCTGALAAIEGNFLHRPAPIRPGPHQPAPARAREEPACARAPEMRKPARAAEKQAKNAGAQKRRHQKTRRIKRRAAERPGRAGR